MTQQRTSTAHHSNAYEEKVLSLQIYWYYSLGHKMTATQMVVTAAVMHTNNHTCLCTFLGLDTHINIIYQCLVFTTDFSHIIFVVKNTTQTGIHVVSG
jgi:hypothetical protein